MKNCSNVVLDIIIQQKLYEVRTPKEVGDVETHGSVTEFEMRCKI